MEEKKLNNNTASISLLEHVQCVHSIRSNDMQQILMLQLQYIKYC